MELSKENLKTKSPRFLPILERLSVFSSLLNSTLKPEEVIERSIQGTRELLTCQSASIELGNYECAHFSESVLRMPLMAKGKCMGSIVVRNGLREFQIEDFKLLEILAPQVGIALENANLYSQLKRNFYDTVEALVEAIEKKDRYTGGHTKRVVIYSLCIAKYMNIPEEEWERIRLGAILHDVGKIGIEDRILKKDSQLEAHEWKVMQNHPQLGFEIMSRVEGLKDVISGMRDHHERWDGLGYPRGLKGEDIPRVARIIAVADTYDAMVSTRPYRKGLPPDIAFQEIVKYSGSQFDPEVVQAFVKAFKIDQMGKKTRPSQLSNCD